LNDRRIAVGGSRNRPGSVDFDFDFRVGPAALEQLVGGIATALDSIQCSQS
jgi:hypothetical protein